AGTRPVRPARRTRSRRGRGTREAQARRRRAPCRSRFRRYRRLDSEVPECPAGIGVTAGKAVAGNVGAKERFEYTVIGEPVNEAARLCELAKDEPGRLLASADTVNAASDDERAHWSL